MNAATITLIVIVVALVWVIVQSRSKPQPKLVVALKPAAVGASVLAPRGSSTLLEDSQNPKAGGSNAAAMVASSSVAFDLA